MKRKSLADKIRETGDATRQELDKSVNVLDEVLSGDAADPVTDLPDHGSGPFSDDKTQSAAKDDRFYSEITSFYLDLIYRVYLREDFSIDDAFWRIGKIVDGLARGNRLLIQALHEESGLKFLAYHSVNVTVFSIRLAEKSGMSRDQQVEVGMAALFHDIGKGRLSDDILYKKGMLSNSETRALQKAPQLSYDLLKPFEANYPYLATCALQVNERVDGSGYPKGLASDAIHPYSKIIGLMDVYEALTHARPHRQKFLHFSAIKRILRLKHSFDKKLLKTFLLTFSVFPLHSYVLLNTDAIGKVVDVHPRYPLRPSLSIVRDSHGQMVTEGQPINLANEPLLFILDSVSDDELGDIATTPDIY